ncbi:MAG: ribonuclease HII, partial [Bacillota bacterium]
GCGPLAGPVVAAAVIWPRELLLPGLNDSKQLAAVERERLYDQILELSSGVAVSVIDSATIDQVNIRQADLIGMYQALQKLPVRPDYVLTDAWRIPDWPGPQLAVIDGDATCLSIAAASVIAKVTRDRLMLEYHSQFPQYGFAQHKGYPTPQHWQALREYGPTPIHRRSFLKHLEVRGSD